MIVEIRNTYLTVKINTFGAELNSMVRNSDGTEMLHAADQDWKRSAPVLFPFVGGVKDKTYSFGGKTYPMGQHGFARDNEFSLLSAGETEAWFSFGDSEETRKVYPFSFTLELGYRLSENVLECIWRVKNPGNGPLYYSIGGHPAFMCPPAGRGKQTDYSLTFDTEEKTLSYGKLSAKGLLESEGHILNLEAGRLPLTEHLFDEDALILEGGQAHRVGIADPSGREYLVVSFDAPLFGLWSPAGKGAPFVCIEPWFGRCDREGFEGSLEEREYGQVLAAGEEKTYSYRIEVMD